MTASHGAACWHVGAEPLTPVQYFSAPKGTAHQLEFRKEASRQWLVSFVIGLTGKPQIKDLILKRVWRARKDSSDEETQVKLSSFDRGYGRFRSLNSVIPFAILRNPSLPPEHLYILHLKSCIKLL